MALSLIQSSFSLELGVPVSPDVHEKSHTSTPIRMLLGRGEGKMEMGVLQEN